MNLKSAPMGECMENKLQSSMEKRIVDAQARVAQMRDSEYSADGLCEVCKRFAPLTRHEGGTRSYDTGRYLCVKCEDFSLRGDYLGDLVRFRGGR